MVKARRYLLLLIHLIAVNGVTATPIERVIWDKRPISIGLAVGQERLIHFPGDIRYWIPETLQTAVTALAANGVLYLQSDKPFIKTRLRVQDIDTQRVYLLDVVSQETGDYPQGIVVTPKSEVVSLSVPATTKPQKTDWPIRLMRFAAQTLYAPERLSPSDSHIRRVSVTTTPINLLRGGETESTPLGQWQGGGFYVTALLVRNLTDQTIEIAPIKDPAGSSDTPDTISRTLYLSHDMRGAWLFTASQHSVLYPAGNDADRTCVYVVSRRPFEGSL